MAGGVGKTWKRAIVGLALAPLPLVAPVTLLFGVTMIGEQDAMSAAQAWLELVVLAYGATLAVGIPVHAVLLRLGRSCLRSYMVATVLWVAIGFVVAVLIQSLVPSSTDQNPFRFILLSRAGIALAVVFATLALGGALIFWVASVRPRQPTTAPPPRH